MKDLTRGNEGKLILRFALPMLLGNVFHQLYNIIDSIIVGNYIGKEALAAVGASFPVIFVFFSLVLGITSGSTVVISQYFGAGEDEKVKRSIETLLIFLFFSSIGISILGIRFSREIFLLLRLPEEVIPMAEQYLKVFFGGVIAFFGFMGISASLRGLGDSMTPLYFLIISTVFNIGFDLLFVIGFGWGITGVAFASIIAQGGAFVTAIFYLNKTHQIIQLSLFKLRFDKSLFRKTLRIGLPTGIQQTVIAAGMMALVWIVNDFGTNVIAAYSVAARVNSLATLPAMNFANALATFVGQNLGAKKEFRVKPGYIATLKMSSVVSITVTLVVVMFGDFIMGLFTEDPQVIQVGREYLTIVGSFYLIFSAMFSTSGVLRGAGATLIPMITTILSLWAIRIPGAYLLSQRFGETGIWWAIPIGWFMGLLMSYAYYLTGKWKNKVVVG
ncbi:MAG: MATE family efflux transporter [Bacteroidales bacterium]|nr:MATE family efflux transporter [Bacteroidales bacterium]